MSDYLCEDLVDEILKRLPPKTLIRFRSLSKTWNDHIANPSFVKMHTLRSMKTPQKVIVRHQRRYTKNSFESFYTLHPSDQYTREKTVNFSSKYFGICGSCNGIICLIKERSKVILWNPSIGRQVSVADPPRSLIVGFGFDSITNDYKIVGIPYPKYEGDAQASFLYSMKTDLWSAIVSPNISCSFVTIVSHPCILNGSLHWVALAKSENIVHYYIMTFDFNTNVFGEISLPQPSWVTKDVTIVNGYLAVISTEGDNVWIWVRREHDKVASWSKAFNLTSRTYEGVDSVFFLSRCYENFKTYNLETGISSTLEIDSDSSFRVNMDMCVESLELLNGDKFDKSYLRMNV